MNQQLPIQDIANMFLNTYYASMQQPRQARGSLINFYSNASRMTYSGSHFNGIKDISEKIESFSFDKIAYQNMSSDVQEGPIPGSLLVFVSGYLMMDDSEQFRFAQVFNLLPNGEGGYYIHNDIFTIIM